MATNNLLEEQSHKLALIYMQNLLSTNQLTISHADDAIIKFSEEYLRVQRLMLDTFWKTSTNR